MGGGEREGALASAHTPLLTTAYPYGYCHVQFYHSLDAGTSWTRLDDPNGNFTFNYAIDLDCEIGENCWVATLDVLTQESSIGRLY